MFSSTSACFLHKLAFLLPFFLTLLCAIVFMFLFLCDWASIFDSVKTREMHTFHTIAPLEVWPQLNRGRWFAALEKQDRIALLRQEFKKKTANCTVKKGRERLCVSVAMAIFPLSQWRGFFQTGLVHLLTGCRGRGGAVSKTKKAETKIDLVSVCFSQNKADEREQERWLMEAGEKLNLTADSTLVFN